MKTKDIAREYGINQTDFEQYLKKVGANCKFGFTGATLRMIYKDMFRDTKYMMRKKKQNRLTKEKSC